MKFLLATLGLFAGLLAPAWAQGTAPSERYFRHMVFRESPMEELAGRHEIAANAAWPLLHHRFRYDAQGRVTEVARVIAGQVTRNPGSFEGFFWWAPQLRIAYAPGQETRSFHDEAGERIAAHGGVWSMEFQLDAQGRRVALAYLDKEGRPVDGAWGAQRYAWQYPEPGVVIETRHNSKGEPVGLRPDFPFHRVRLEFGHDQLLDFVLNLDEQDGLRANDSGAAVDRIHYDPWLNFVRWQVFDTQRRPHNGNAPGVALGEHVYDGLGQARLLRGFGVQGEDRALAGYPGPMRFEYDRHGNLLRQQYLNMAGELQYESRLSYSDDGSRLDWVRYFDGQGRVSSPPRLPAGMEGMVAQQMQYDSLGRRSGSVRYGQDGKRLVLS